MNKYKLKLSYGDSTLIITINKNRVTLYEGSLVLEALVKPRFEKSVNTLTGKLTRVGSHITIQKIFKPGQEGFIDAVLPDVIQNELGMDYELYTEENNI